MNTSQKYNLIEMTDDRYGENSTAMISQLPVSECYGIIGNNTLANATLERIFHNSTIRLN